MGQTLTGINFGGNLQRNVNPSLFSDAIIRDLASIEVTGLTGTLGLNNFTTALA